ncbi:uncharacterized protein Z518_01656 [Rhinocladiella mackenziei CBS 650.93]|uniref:Monocarboxylate transporter n=1 Tax=Rhinocladiella mackenziei CBS 650.93 TaxID=1442369 RepID=A0A0D2G6J1_9EURO|nr:uncharacterized protein Z518_01656 [Rhinocladiella mackenziei CBS 650.93]KIX10572.1 hypothetical protein Z518_01656 [Rhinocladiella mackenziei CBS 650.93]
MSQNESDEIDLSVDRHAGRDDADHEAAEEQELARSNRNRVRVLLGSSLLQLPIWGFSMSFGVFQEFFSDPSNSHTGLRGSHSATGVIGTTSNGVIYLSMPFLFAALSQQRACVRHVVAFAGIAFICLSYFLSSFSTYIWQVIATQGVLAAFGSALLASPTTLFLGECFATSNRAVAYGVMLSAKNIVGSTCPFLLRGLLDRYGFRITMRIWTAIVTGSSLFAMWIFLTASLTKYRARRHTRARIAWQFLKHQTFYIYSIATMMQSSGYGIPQTYLNTYAHDAASLSQASATLLLTLFNLPGIISCSFFGYLSDNKRYPLSATTTTCISSLSSALSVFLLWGLASPSSGSMAILMLFSITFGFFAGGYSSTWGGIITQMEREAAERNEPVDTGVLYGLLNGARGLGYVSGGLAGVPLLKTGNTAHRGRAGYGTEYGPLIVFTGLSLVFGGWSIMWQCKKLSRWIRCFLT